MWCHEGGITRTVLVEHHGDAAEALHEQSRGTARAKQGFPKDTGNRGIAYAYQKKRAEES